ncbi:hypothetical protein SAMN05444370_1814, partial [Rubrimonas cliftonensis]
MLIDTADKLRDEYPKRGVAAARAHVLNGKRLWEPNDSVEQITAGPDFPFPRTDSSYGFGDGYAEGG